MTLFRRLAAAAVALWLLCFPSASDAAGSANALVFQTDFGLKDGAVSAMKGVAYGVDPDLRQFDLTHEVPAYNAWEAGYRLQQTTPFWPAGTVFVNVVDPGVGTDRLPVVALTRTGQYVVTPDNGALTFLAESPGIVTIRVIDAARHRRPGSEASYTFHGRDLFAYVGARLACGKLAFDQVGPVKTGEAIQIEYPHARLENGGLKGAIPVLDPQYGNVWSNIPKEVTDQLGLRPGDMLEYQIHHGPRLVATGRAPFANTFGAVPKGKPLVYLNSLLNLSLALNQGSFAERHHIGSGPDWSVTVRRADK